MGKGLGISPIRLIRLIREWEGNRADGAGHEVKDRGIIEEPGCECSPALLRVITASGEAVCQRLVEGAD